jgi:hypothetical protein
LYGRSIIGSVLLVAGLYNVLWGKSREDKQQAAAAAAGETGVCTTGVCTITAERMRRQAGSGRHCRTDHVLGLSALIHLYFHL